MKNSRYFTVLYSLLLLGIFIQAQAQQVTPNTKIRIAALGHSYLVGNDDLVGVLPKMLKLRKNVDVEWDFQLGQAAGFAWYLVEDRDRAREAWYSRGDFDESMTKKAEEWAKLTARLDKNPDYFIFLTGTSGNFDGRKGASLRIFAAKIRELYPNIPLIPFAQYGFGETYKDFCKSQNSMTAAYHTIMTDFDFTAMDTLPPTEYRYESQRLFFDEAEKLGPIVDDVFIAPCGEAWREVYRSKGDMSLLCRSLSNRDPHGNLWGNYINCCVVYSLLTGEKFDGNGFSSTLTSPKHNRTLPEEYRGTIPDSWARFFEKTAWDIWSKQVPYLSSLQSGESPVSPWIEDCESVNVTPVAIELNYKRVYNDEGQLTEHSIYDENKNIENRTFYAYDANGRITQETRLNSSGDTSGVTRYEYVIQDGLVTEIRHLDGNGTHLGSDKFKYDANSRKIEEAFYEPDNTFDAIYRYDYNTENLVSKRRFYNAADELQGEQFRSYDSDGRLSQTKEYDVSSSSCTTTVSYTYGEPIGGESIIAQKKIEENCRPDKETLVEYDYTANGDIKEERTYKVADGEKTLTVKKTYENVYGSTNLVDRVSHRLISKNITAYKLYTLQGRFLRSTESHTLQSVIRNLPSGLYVVRSGSGLVHKITITCSGQKSGIK